MATSIAVRHAPHASSSLTQSRLTSQRAASRPSLVVAFSSGQSLAVRCRRLSQQSVSLRQPGPAYRRSVRAAAAAAAAAEGKDGEAQLSAEEAQDLSDIQDILETIELLKERRDMTVQEIRLVLMIEDPREAERRRQMGIENESGCSRDEIADAFLEVCEDRVPADRMVLRKLAQDMRDWPRLRVFSLTPPPTPLPHRSPPLLSPSRLSPHSFPPPYFSTPLPRPSFPLPSPMALPYSFPHSIPNPSPLPALLTHSPSHSSQPPIFRTPLPHPSPESLTPLPSSLPPTLPVPGGASP
ncbi:unnamed protein product [Closterium sp. NIES-54]